MTTYELFMPLNGELSADDMEQIIQSLITHGDGIWLPENFRLAPNLAADTASAFKRTLEEMREAKLLKLWTLEGMGKQSESRASLVIPSEGQAELREQIDFSVMPSARVEQKEPPIITSDSASQLIKFRHELWHLGVAARCGSTAIVFGNYGDGTLENAGANYQNISKDYSKKLFEQFQMPSLLGLNCDDVLKLRTEIRSYRFRLDALLTEATANKAEEAQLVENCRKMYAEYLSIVGDAVHERAVPIDRDTAIHGICHIAAIALPVVGFLPFASKFGNWLIKRHQYRFALYMHTVRKIGTERTNVK